MITKRWCVKHSLPLAHSVQLGVDVCSICYKLAMRAEQERDKHDANSIEEEHLLLLRNRQKPLNGEDPPMLREVPTSERATTQKYQRPFHFGSD